VTDLRQNLPVRQASIALLLASALSLGGCSLLQLRQENRDYASATVLVGRVLPEGGWRGAVSVAAITQRDGHAVIEHAVWLHEPGGFELIVVDGSYTLVAYGDRDNDGRPDADAPAGTVAEAVQVAGTGFIPMLDIPLKDGARQSIRELLPPNYHRAPRPSSAAGALADLDLARFSASAGKHGYWAPLEFFRSFGGNIYFIEPYDPARTPVLFVHGATGSAQDWRYFVEHLDRQRYQPWIFQYPSGAPLEAMSHLLYWKLLNLQMRYGFARLELVAHSMGGLVARRFLLDHAAEFPQIGQFVSISTPWGGQPSAASGVKHSPAVVPSWRDIQPQGEFLHSLFARPLPPGIAHSLLFGHQDGAGVLRDASDGTISVASQLRPEARAGAALVMGFQESHAGILSSPEVVSEVERLFAADAAGGGGKLGIAMNHPAGSDGPTGIATIVMRQLDGALARRRENLLLAIAADGGKAAVGPIAPGEYEVRLVVAPFRAQPDRQRVRIMKGAQAEVRFNLVPDGMLIGEVLRESSRIDMPAGSMPRADNAIRVDAIRLEGPGGARELVPRREAQSSLLDAYLDGRNDASNQLFCFMGLAEGEYVLTVRASGYETNVSRYTVVPGRHPHLPPVIMRKAGASRREVTR